MTRWLRLVLHELYCTCRSFRAETTRLGARIEIFFVPLSRTVVLSSLSHSSPTLSISTPASRSIHHALTMPKNSPEFAAASASMDSSMLSKSSPPSPRSSMSSASSSIGSASLKTLASMPEPFGAPNPPPIMFSSELVRRRFSPRGKGWPLRRTSERFRSGPGTPPALDLSSPAPADPTMVESPEPPCE